MNSKIVAKTKKIKLLLVDVDGVLTPGNIYVSPDGNEMYEFNIYDGYGLELWKKAGLKSGFVSGRESTSVVQRAKKLGIDFIYVNVKDKVAIFNDIAKTEGLIPGNIAFIGDDLPDLAVLKSAGFAVAVANARKEVKKYAHYITKAKGGEGAVREVIEFILKAKGLWSKILKKSKE